MPYRHICSAQRPFRRGKQASIMQRSIRALVTIVPLRFPDRIEVQTLLLDSDDHLTSIGEIYAPEPWHVWRTRLEASEAALDDAEFTLARSEAAQFGALLLSLPDDLFGREFVLEPS